MTLRPRAAWMFAPLLLLSAAALRAEEPFASSYETEKSTAPLRQYPTAFTRKLAERMSVPVEDLEKVEKRGYGRTEMALLILISRRSSRTWSEIVKERDKGATLEEIAMKDKLEYLPLFREAEKIRAEVHKQVKEKEAGKDKKEPAGASSPAEPVPAPPPILPPTPTEP